MGEEGTYWYEEGTSRTQAADEGDDLIPSLEICYSFSSSLVGVF